MRWESCHCAVPDGIAVTSGCVTRERLRRSGQEDGKRAVILSEAHWYARSLAGGATLIMDGPFYATWPCPVAGLRCSGQLGHVMARQRRDGVDDKAASGNGQNRGWR